MEHDEHVQLISSGITGRSWAELGSGRGAFVLALAEILGSAGRIYSVDRDPSALSIQKDRLQVRFPTADVVYIHADFTRPLELPLLDGILMANSLHFIPYAKQAALLMRVKGYLRPGGRIVIVEYDAQRGNMWVPHPFPYERWEKMAARAGFIQTRQLSYRPGGFLNGMYSAVSVTAQDK